jgi:hypothetical protein
MTPTLIWYRAVAGIVPWEAERRRPGNPDHRDGTHRLRIIGGETRMTNRILSKRLERLETRMKPTCEPLVYEIQFVAAVDGSIVSRLPMKCGFPSAARSNSRPVMLNHKTRHSMRRWSVRAIIRRIDRLAANITRSDVRGPSPATILCERRRRRLAACGLAN